MLEVSFQKTVDRMADSLMEEAENQGKSLEGLTADNFNNFIDDLLDPTGEVRCEKFCDLAWEYSSRFGELGDDKFNDKQWRCTKAAIAKINRRLKEATDNERSH